MSRRIKRYDQIRGDLKTGDVVLFSGRGLFSLGIRIGTGSKWSHVGMILRLDDFDFVCLWESTTLSNIADLSTGQRTKGVQLVGMMDRIKDYEGEISIRQLRGVELNKDQVGVLRQFRHELKGRPYEQDRWELLHSASPFTNREDLSSIFCSELVAETYQRLGLLDKSKPSNEYTPADFGESRDLILKSGYLDEEIGVVS